MLRNVFALIVFAGLTATLLTGCQPTVQHSLRPTLDDQGELQLYLQPFPQEAEKLRFSLQSIAAVKTDGTLVEFPLALNQFRGSELKRQRIFAAGQLPPGNYTGLSLTVENAFLQGEEGEAALVVSKEPYFLEFPFQIHQGKELLLTLRFSYGRSVSEGVAFSPGFSIFLPERLVDKLVGYVANEQSDTITIFDRKALQVVGAIATGAEPKSVALDRVRRRAYVVLSGANSVALVDVSQHAIIDRLRLSVGDEPVKSALTPDGNLLVTANFGSNTVSLIEPLSMMETARIRVGDGPSSVLIDQTGRRAYVLNRWSGTVSVIDLANRLLAATLPVGPEPMDGAFNRVGDRLFLIHARSPYLTVIDPVALTVLPQGMVGRGSSGIVMDRRTNLLYIAKKLEGTVEAYDPLALFSVRSIRVGEEVGELAIDDELGNLYIALPKTGRVAVYNLLGRKMVTTIEVGKAPCGITLMGER